MPISVTDARSNFNDQIAHAAARIGRSTARAAVFKAICYGKKEVKTVGEIVNKTALTRKQVLNEGKRLANNQLVGQTRKDGDTAYEKDSFYSAHYGRILDLARHPTKLAELPTKVRPAGGTRVIRIVVPKVWVRAKFVTVDQIDSFAKVKTVKTFSNEEPLPEARLKRGMQTILKEEGTFRDWGGERNDLWTTRLTFEGKRRRCAFAFKGKATKGRLTPAKLGKNGDQLQRLFSSSADFFVVQYWGQIDESVVSQMEALAISKSAVGGSEIWYCAIDAADSSRLFSAYKKYFS